MLSPLALSKTIMKKVKAEQKLINEISAYQVRIAETEERIANEERVSDDEKKKEVALFEKLLKKLDV